MTFSPKPKPPKKAKGKKQSGGIKITNPDKWFSLCVRERADWTCQHCGKRYEPDYTVEGLPKAQGLHCSHFIGRGNWSVRHEPLNAEAHCYGCHAKFEGDPDYFTNWMQSRLGSLYEILIEKKNNIMIGKQARREQDEIAAHYKAEFERMRRERDNGKVGRINFQGYF